MNCQMRNNSLSLESFEQEQSDTEISVQLKGLKDEVLLIKENFTKSSLRLLDKQEENLQLREKLMALEISVQHLFENSRIAATGCCSQGCELI